MHAVMRRRMPAERAIHAKRLGYAALNPIAFSVTGQQGTALASSSTSQTSTTVSTSQFSSSAPPTSSTTHSSSSATTSSQPTSAASSATPSTDTTQTTSFASPTTLAQPTTSTLSVYPTSSSTSAPPTDVATASSRGLSGGAIAGIIAGGVIVGVALIVFLVRKTYLRRREREHISWNGASDMGAGIPDEPKFPNISDGLVSFPSIPHRGAPPPLSPFEAHGQSIHSDSVSPAVRMQTPANPSYFVPPPPPATYNNPTPVSAYPTQLLSSTRGSASTAAFAMGHIPLTPAHHVPPEVAVKFTFVPTLPDELSIATGERVFVLEEYDDGWNLCANRRGERGMVPRECLDRPLSNQSGIGWGNMPRLSSLNPDGPRF